MKFEMKCKNPARAKKAEVPGGLQAEVLVDVKSIASISLWSCDAD